MGDITGAVTLPQPGDEVGWVRAHLGGLYSDAPRASGRFRGTQAAADAALSAFDVSGYAGRRNDVMPVNRRGASGLSPWIRHGMLTLPAVWSSVSGPSRDVTKFRDELLWQEYARHVYARMGVSMQQPLRYEPHRGAIDVERHDPWDRSMACMDMVVGELHDDGWMVNQTRMWLASQWTVRHGADWRDGEDYFFRHLLDGSRAANRLGWQWTVGAGTGKPYGFSRWQVNKRAPGLCDGCQHRTKCPIERWPDDTNMVATRMDSRLRSIDDVATVRGPIEPVVNGAAEMVWLTAESMGDDDPALQAHGDLAVVFVFDAPLLRTLQLSAKRLVFLTQRLSELAQQRNVTVSIGDPEVVLRSVPVATTFAPVPGFRQRARSIAPVALYPWPWLRPPTAGPVTSFSAWRNSY
jgi:deoxyribodipyrimidine photo-lyase